MSEADTVRALLGGLEPEQTFEDTEHEPVKMVTIEIPEFWRDRLEAFVNGCEEDDPVVWVPMWIRREVAMRLTGGTAEDFWTNMDSELNQSLHEHLEAG
jgi:hypothetical protein